MAKTKLDKKIILGTKRYVSLVTGKNYYSRQQTIPVIGKLPSKKVSGSFRTSEWGNVLGLRDSSVKKVLVSDFIFSKWPIIVVESGSGYDTLMKGSDY